MVKQANDYERASKSYQLCHHGKELREVDGARAIGVCFFYHILNLGIG